MTPHDDFDLLLEWLDPDREAAALEYESLRQRLIRYFAGRGCFEAETLADDTIVRVTGKVRELVKEYVGKPAAYFYGVAGYVFLEWLRTQKRKPPPPATSMPEEIDEIRHRCLEECLAELPEQQRILTLDYYQEEKRAKIEHRRALAQRLGITINALHIRVCRIVNRLEKCVRQCVVVGSE